MLYILCCFYHRWIVAIGLYIIYIYIMLSGHPHIFTYIFYVIIVYIICYPGHPHMFTYVSVYIYIYCLIGSPTHTHIYKYFLTPQRFHSAITAATAGCCCCCCWLLLHLWRDGGDAGLSKRSNSWYIYIYKVSHLNGIYKIGGKYSHNIFEIYIYIYKIYHI